MAGENSDGLADTTETVNRDKPIVVPGVAPEDADESRERLAIEFDPTSPSVITFSGASTRAIRLQDKRHASGDSD